MNGANLPNELTWEILSRLPAKSLGRFKCVSKPWRTLISDPKFIKHQLTHTNRHRESVIFSRVFQPLVVVDFEGDPFDKGRITSVLEFDQPNGWLAVCGSCHGLVLALTVKHELYLINPTFKESKKLSFPGPFGVCRSGVFGFGYDSLADDYKVVIFVSDAVWIYTLKHSCWKIVKIPSFRWLVSEPLLPEVGDSGVLVNGSIHLLAKKYVDSSLLIVAFDLADEIFHDVPLPCDLADESELEIRVLSGCLCLTNSKTDVWVMREYGVKESWTKFLVYQPRSYHIRPLLLSGDENFMLIMNRGKLVVYNAKEKTSTDIECHGLSVKRGFQVRTFAASLVSPKQWV